MFEGGAGCSLFYCKKILLWERLEFNKEFPMIRNITKAKKSSHLNLERKGLRKLDTGEILFMFGFTSIIFLTILAILCFTSCGVVQKLDDMLGVPDDNVVEEMVENVIESKTGIDFDLTPRSPEKKTE